MSKVFISEAPADNYTAPPLDTVECRVTAHGVKPSRLMGYWEAWQEAKRLFSLGYSNVRYEGILTRYL